MACLKSAFAYFPKCVGVSNPRKLIYFDKMPLTPVQRFHRPSPIRTPFLYRQHFTNLQILLSPFTDSVKKLFKKILHFKFENYVKLDIGKICCDN